MLDYLAPIEDWYMDTSMDYSPQDSSFYNPENSWEGLTSPMDYESAVSSTGYLSPDWDNLGLIQGFGDYGGAAPSSLIDQATGWLGDNWKTALSTGLGLLGAYGNYQANQDQRNLLKAQTASQRASAQAALARIALEDRAQKAQQASDLSGRASIANILANRGHLAAGQSNPWLNYLYQAQKESGFTPQGPNPFEGSSVGQAVTPYSMEQLMAGIQNMSSSTPRVGYAGGGMVLRGALNALRGTRGEEAVAKHLAEMRAMAEQFGRPFNEQAELDYLNGVMGKIYPERPEVLPTEPIRRRKGGLGLISGQGGGQDDMVDAKLSPDEFVIPADVVSDLGDGSPEHGSEKLYDLIDNVRTHKGKPKKLPPKSKSALSYLGK